MAHARWIALLDADDDWRPDHLKELSQVAEQFPDAGLISANIMEARGRALPDWPKPNVLPLRRKVDYFLEASKVIGFIDSSSCAVRREAYVEMGESCLSKRVKISNTGRASQSRTL